MATLISEKLNKMINATLSRFVNYDPLNLIKKYLFHDNTSLEYAKILAEKRNEVLNEINEAVSRKNRGNFSMENYDKDQKWVFISRRTPRCNIGGTNCSICGNYLDTSKFEMMFELPEICLCHC
jgi:hypothetical protein